MGWIKFRFDYLRKATSRRCPKWVLIFWVIISIWDTAVGQFLSPELAAKMPTVYKVLSMVSGWLPGWAWLFLGLVLLLLISVEYGVRQRRLQSLDKIPGSRTERNLWMLDALNHIAGDIRSGEVERFTAIGNACAAIRQSVIDHDLPTWGKATPNDNAWQPIPRDFWNSGRIWLQSVFDGDREKVRTETSRKLDVPTWYALMTNKARVEELWPKANT